MPKVFVVDKAFLSTEADKKTPQVINTQGGEMHKFMVQFKDQSIPGWIGILKKPGNQVNVGDEMYGVIEENNWGKPQFTRMQLPQDGSVQLKTGGAPAPTQQAAAPKQQSTQPSGTVEEKLDYLITLVEGFLESQGNSPTRTQTTNDVSPEDIEDGPVDLSQLDY